ncbi:ADP-ribosylglycohydrolase family protein [Coleofasciculus sp. G2-EDA-02]|uniref:ADP-ribosylglycohydrolase family protein n=1 Tax=Coleofasciculus sp. G2-EDA-02 TaxID=3069529 RepID=UPI0032F4A855
MQHSVISRFQGALLGSLIGELVSHQPDQELGSPVGWKSLHLAKSQPKPTQSHLYIPQLSDWSKISTCGIESLIDTGRLDIDDWIIHCRQTQPSLLELKGKAQSSEAAVLSLQMALFFHENPEWLRQTIIQAAAIWQVEPNASAGVLAIAMAMAVMLTETINPTTLIPHILRGLGTQPTVLAYQLQQVQTLIEAGADLETTTRNVRREPANLGNRGDASDMAIALAFYCFLYTPEDFRLCVLRAVRSGYHNPITAALTGALAGVYQGINGIPVSWRLAALKIPALENRRQLTEQFFAVWLGVYDQNNIKDRYKQAAVAAPGVIQRRLLR